MKKLLITGVALLGVTTASADEARNTVVEASSRGVALWKKSCRRPSSLGDCTKTRIVAPKHRCSSQIEAIKLRKRNAKRARRAVARLNKAVAAYEAMDADSRDAASGKAAATARFYLAEQSFEDVLELAFPTGLNFSPDKPKRLAASKKRFLSWLGDIKSRSEKAANAYAEIVKDPHAPAGLRVAAAGRTGQIYRRFALVLRGAEIPVDLRSGKFADEAKDAYCDAVWQEAEPIEQVAIQAHQKCLDLAKDHNVDEKWKDHCVAIDSGVAADDSTVRRYTSRVRFRLAKCAPQDFEGKVELRFDVESGKAQNFAARGISDKAARRCLRTVIESVDYPRSSKSVSISYPLVFRK